MPTRLQRAKSLGIPVDQLPDGRGRHANHARGEKAGRWNQGVIVSSGGYRKIRVGTGHPLADPNGYAYEHLLVWCGAGNPRPLANELLHHKNENKLDNRIENIELVTRGQHNQIHNAERGRDEQGRLLPSKTTDNLLAGAAKLPTATPTPTEPPAEPLTLLQRVEILERAWARVVLAAGNNAMRACGSERHPATEILGGDA